MPQLTDGSLEVDVEPQLGMTIRALRPLPDRRNLLWERPGHKGKPGTRDLGPAGAASIETLHGSLVGGWFEMSPQAGLPGELDGQETMLHGEACRLPWTVEVAKTSVLEAVVGCVRYPLALRRSITVDGGRVDVRSTISNVGAAAVSVTHGEHPCFSREVFAGGVIDARVRSAVVLPALDPAYATLAAGPFEWPRAPVIGGGLVDVASIPPGADRSHDHIALELAGDEVSVRTNDGLAVTIVVDLKDHPFMLFWRNFGAGSAPGHGGWDVFALEPQSAPGRSVSDAVESGRVGNVGPGESLAFGCTLEVSRG
jgi:galactose mutarotase-like enzyme